MLIKMQVIEPTKEKESCNHKMVSYKNDVEMFKQVEVKRKQKTTTLIYYVGVDVDVSKLLTNEG